MNEYLLSVILGIIEGLTEFLPVSSTAHLRIAEELLQVSLQSEYWKMYSVVIQLGAVLCLPVYFWGRIRKFVATFPQGETGNRTIWTHPLSLVMIAFVVTAGPCYLADKLISAHLENLPIMGAALLIGGVLMWVVDTGCRQPKTLHVEEMGFFQAIFIGAAQILSAAFPGTSRSMITIAAGQVGGMSRAAALEFSFFLSIPTMFAATAYKLSKPLLKHDAAVPMTGHNWIILAIGFVVSFLVAYAVVAWFMYWVRKHGFTPFAIYRIVLGLGVLIWQFNRA